MKRLRPFLVTVALHGALLILGCAAARAGQVSPTQRLVWAHAMIVFPLDLDVVKPWLPEGYEGAYPSYPLDARRNWPGGQWHPPDVRSAKAAGLDGFSIDIFTDGNAANGYLDAADALGGFQIAACLDGGTDEQIVNAVVTYCASAAKHPSAAKVGDAFVIFTYGTAGGDNTPERWKRLRDEITKRGCKTWWMPDLGSDFSRPDYQERIASFLPLFDAGYDFGSASDKLGAVAALYRAHGKPFGGGMMPGYYRAGGGLSDARSTQTYRDEWKRHLAARPNWAHVATWNDLAETTEIMPNSDFNITRTELTCWFAAKFRRQPVGWTQPKLYVTTPKTAYLGQTATVEALALNPTARPLQVSVQLLDSQRRPFGKPQTATVRPGEDGAATIPLTLTTPPPGHFLRARATLRDGARIVASVIGAPLCVLDPEAQPGFVPLYYSVPAHRALPGAVKLTLTGRPTGGQTARAGIVAPPHTRAQFSEVLFNGEILKNFLAEAPTPLDVPRHRQSAGGAQPAGEIKGGTEWGFYLARMTDSQYRVGYSDPIYLPPHGDLTLKEKYAFDDGAGPVAHDASAFGRAGELQDVAWVTPGAGGTGGAVSFNGKNSRLNLGLALTPPGPLSIKMAVRPRAYGGHFFCDAGGMWMTTTADGKPQFTRLSPGGWATATGKTTLLLNAWTPLELVWDGTILKIFVKGRLDAEAPCGPKFGSWRRALGCNPFGSGSAFYDGDLDNFEMRALSPKVNRAQEHTSK